MQIKGWTNDITSCSHCGKTGLARTCEVVTDEGATIYYGSVCIGHVYGKNAGKEMTFLADCIAQIGKSKDPARFALIRFGWGVSQRGETKGWIVDRFQRPIFQVAA